MEPSSSARAAAIRPRSPTAIVIAGTPALPEKKRARWRAPGHGAVDAEQDGGAGDALAMERGDHADVGRGAPPSRPRLPV